VQKDVERQQNGGDADQKSGKQEKYSRPFMKVANLFESWNCSYFLF